MPSSPLVSGVRPTSRSILCQQRIRGRTGSQ